MLAANPMRQYRMPAWQPGCSNNRPRFHGGCGENSFLVGHFYCAKMADEMPKQQNDSESGICYGISN